MIDHEPYVADPHEAPVRPRLLGVRPLLVALLVLIALTGGAFLVLENRSVQDPSLDRSTPAADAPPDA